MSIFKELIDYSNSKSEYETKSFKEYRSKLRDKENKKEHDKEIYKLIEELLKDITSLYSNVDTQFIHDYIFSNAYRSGSSVEVINNDGKYVFSGKLGSQEIYKLNLSLSDTENKKLNFAYYQTPDVVLIRNKNPHIKMEELSYKLQDKKGKKM